MVINTILSYLVGHYILGLPFSVFQSLTLTLILTSVGIIKGYSLRVYYDSKYKAEREKMLNQLTKQSDEWEMYDKSNN